MPGTASGAQDRPYLLQDIAAETLNLRVLLAASTPTVLAGAPFAERASFSKQEGPAHTLIKINSPSASAEAPPSATYF